ncbi:OmpH family outer membrane protein [Thalassovita aquimarina]|uniref:OmpH family outer membrane protein n=1 Tax=Thalassovita aquimarina TaxID=2785917 RepID=UPI003561EAEC
MRVGWRNRLAAICLALVAAGGPATVAAQESGVVRSPVLTIDSERLYADSLFGKRVQNEFEAAVAVLEAENREIEGQLIEEEKQLTEKRPGMAPEEFRVLADAFDAKVQRIRNERAAKLRALAQSRENAQRLFLKSISPVLESIMTEAGAAVIVESRSVFLSARIIDVTSDAVSRIDARIGDGSDLQQPEQQ